MADLDYCRIRDKKINEFLKSNYEKRDSSELTRNQCDDLRRFAERKNANSRYEFEEYLRHRERANANKTDDAFILKKETFTYESPDGEKVTHKTEEIVVSERSILIAGVIAIVVVIALVVIIYLLRYVLPLILPNILPGFTGAAAAPCVIM